ncbi:MAG: sigma-54 dependent transcriptional regulator [Nitrospirota bacterium]
MTNEKILVVDDEQSMRELLTIMLKREGYLVTSASNGEEGIKALNKEIFDLVITDMKMPKVSGLELLRIIKEIAPQTIVLMITAFASTETAVEAMKEGAYDYLTKPFKIDEVKFIINNALEKKRLKEENVLLKKELSILSGIENIIGKSNVMKKVFEIVRKIADTNCNVLISGESGTGKELIARAIHFNSTRKDSPFITINCAALPETLLESELFGHMKGSFTGAIANKEGLFEMADSGTILLDEIGETPASIQVKLLRVIQEREFRRIGGLKDIKVDVRIIAATNMDLDQAVKDGRFREDLFYRLDVIRIYIPPLRERTEDIPLLSGYFLDKFKRRLGREIKGFAPEAINLLMGSEWRGNVRELENVIERAAAMAGGDTIRIEDLREYIQKPVISKEAFSQTIPDGGIDLEGIMEGMERDMLIKALERANWIKTKAAKLLHLDFRSFRYRLEKYGIKDHKGDRQ